jgi:hypothetical protein
MPLAAGGIRHLSVDMIESYIENACVEIRSLAVREAGVSVGAE